MAINKVTFDGHPLIDLSTDTVTTANDIALGKIGHLKDGTIVTGTHSGGVSPSGEINISANGTYDVTNYASAVVAIPVANCKMFSLTFSTDIEETTTIVSGDSAIAAHYADTNAVAVLELLDQPEAVQSISVIYAANRKIANVNYYQMRMQNASGTGFSAGTGGNALNSTGSENHRLQINSSGDVIVKISGRPLKAGNWRLTFIW